MIKDLKLVYKKLGNEIDEAQVWVNDLNRDLDNTVGNTDELINEADCAEQEIDYLWEVYYAFETIIGYLEDEDKSRD